MKYLYPSCIIFAAALWGVDGVLLTPRLYNLPVPLVVFLLHFIPIVLLTPIFWYKWGREIKSFLCSKKIFIALIVSLFGGCIGTLAIVKSLFLVNFNQLSLVIVLQKLQPVFAIVLARLFLKEHCSRRFLIWASVAIVASYFITFGLHLPSIDQTSHFTLAAMYSLLAAFCFGSATVVGRKLVTSAPFAVVHYARFLLTSVIMGIAVLVLGDFASINKVTVENAIVFLTIALTTGSTAIFIYYFGLQKVKAQTSTICELFFPLTAVVLDYAINGSIFTWSQMVAAAILLISIVRIAFLFNKN